MKEYLTVRRPERFQAYLELIHSRRTVPEDGKIQVQSLGMIEEWAWTLATILTEHQKITLNEAHHAIRSVLLSSELTTQFDITTLVKMCNIEIAARRASENRPFLFVTRIVNHHALRITDFKLNGAETSFVVDSKYVDAHDTLIRDQFQQSEVPELENFIPVSVKVNAKSADSAHEIARDALDLIRACTNLSINSIRYARYTIGKRWAPFNEVLVSKFGTMHDLVEEKPIESIYYYTEWTPPKLSLHVDEKKQTIIHERVTKNLYSLQKHSPIRKSANEVLLRYVRALDTVDWRTAFLELWSVGERLAGIGTSDTHKELGNRLTKFSREPELDRLVFDHLKVHRNKVVHEAVSLSLELSEILIFQLNRYLSHSITLLHRNKFELNSMQSWYEMLTLPHDPKQLSDLKALIEQMEAFKTSS